jgi:hypothetical protein
LSIRFVMSLDFFNGAAMSSWIAGLLSQSDHNVVEA